MQKTRRQFSVEITKCDGFIAMSAGAQALYLQLLGACDDEGFTSSIALCKYMAHATDEDEAELVRRRFIFVFESDGVKVAVIKHWRMNNWIRNERVTESSFVERSKVYVKPNGNYTLSADEGVPLDNSEAVNCQPDVCQVSDNPLTSNKRESKTKRKPTQSIPIQTNPYTNQSNPIHIQTNTPQSNPTQSTEGAYAYGEIDLDELDEALGRKRKE